MTVVVRFFHGAGFGASSVGGEATFTAMGNFADGMSEYLTATCTWASSDEAVATIGESGVLTRGYVANVADEQQVEQLFTDIGRDFEALHGLINNAAVLSPHAGPIREAQDYDEMHRLYDVNALGPVRVVEALLTASRQVAMIAARPSSVRS